MKRLHPKRAGSRLPLIGLTACALTLAAIPTSQAQLSALKRSLDAMTKPASTAQPAEPAQPAGAKDPTGVSAPSANSQQLSMAGYPLRFRGVRELLHAGQFDDARKAFLGEAPLPETSFDAQDGAKERKLKPLAEKGDVFLRNAELGVMQFDAGDFEGAVQSLRAAEAQSGASATSSDGKNSVKGKAMSMLAKVGGNEELGPYSQHDYEQILQLNYLSLSHLMRGDRSAFNVTRRAAAEQNAAIDDLNDRATLLQDNSRAAFATELVEAAEAVNKLRSTLTSAPAVGLLEGQLSGTLARFDTVATRVASAYVNPLGPFLSGVVFEVSSVQDPALRSNARVAYQKALQLYPNSKHLAVAARDTGTAKPKAGRLVHVIVGEGFAPTRQMLVYSATINDVAVPIKVPIYVPNPSKVARVQVETGLGAPTILEPAADVEAIVMRKQKDRTGAIFMGIALNVGRALVERDVASKAGAWGNIALNYKQKHFDKPDLRSWSSLPARFHIGRMMIPNTVSHVQIVSYDRNGRRLASSEVAIDRSIPQNVLYARAVDDVMVGRLPARLWISGS